MYSDVLSIYRGSTENYMNSSRLKILITDNKIDKVPQLLDKNPTLLCRLLLEEFWVSKDSVHVPLHSTIQLKCPNCREWRTTYHHTICWQNGI